MQGLEQAGLRVPAILPPTVPPGTARLRIALGASHREKDVESLVLALRELSARASSGAHQVGRAAPVWHLEREIA